MNAAELLSRIEALGVSVKVDAGDLILRFDVEPPGELVQELREHKAEVLSYLNQSREQNLDDDPVSCRGCATLIPAGTTLCVECGSARSPLVRYAVQLGGLAEERTLRGRALLALDKRRYPKLKLPDGRTVGPGLLAWCPILRDGNAASFRDILKLITRAKADA